MYLVTEILTNRHQYDRGYSSLSTDLKHYITRGDLISLTMIREKAPMLSQSGASNTIKTVILPAFIFQILMTIKQMECSVTASLTKMVRLA